MRLAILASLAFVASAFAYRVLTPNANQGWTNVGAQPSTWERVETDRLNFTAVLVNQANSYNQVLAAQVDGTLAKASFNPPSTGWPLGDGFRLNFVQDSEHLDSILAQTGEFSIKAPNVSSSVSSPLPTTFTVPTTTAPVVAPSTSSSAGPSSGNTNPPGTNGALSTTISIGVVASCALLGIYFA